MSAPIVLKRAPLALTGVKFSTSGTTRTLRGIASTPELDRQGDTLDPMGATFQLPLPLLLGHDHAAPVGHVTEARATPSGIHVVCTVASGIKRADEVWAEIEAGLFKSFSVGFIGLESKPTKTGLHFSKWEMIELSVVTVPANAGARITATKGAEQRRLVTIPKRRHSAIQILRAPR